LCQNIHSTFQNKLFGKKSRFMIVWTYIGRHFGRFLDIIGRFLDIIGRFLDIIGRFLDRFGQISVQNVWSHCPKSSVRKISRGHHRCRSESHFTTKLSTPRMRRNSEIHTTTYLLFIFLELTKLCLFFKIPTCIRRE
jgi:hypothetical protein